MSLIQKIWPEVFDDIGRYVKMIIHVPSQNFRSCSAVRYKGIVFLASTKESSVDLGESMIHEYGHQKLYEVMMLNPILKDTSGKSFTLPWSGQKRDLYGYFHAFYIYILLVKYYHKLIKHMEGESTYFQRCTHIINGLNVAVKEMEDHRSNFTEMGTMILNNLKKEIMAFTVS